MSEYTPSFERVRDVYSWAYAWRTRDNVDEGESDLSGLRESNRAEFDRSLAAHDAAVRSDQIEKDITITLAEKLTDGTNHPEDAAYDNALDDVAAAIRAQLAEGETNV